MAVRDTPTDDDQPDREWHAERNRLNEMAEEILRRGLHDPGRSKIRPIDSRPWLFEYPAENAGIVLLRPDDDKKWIASDTYQEPKQ